MNRITIDPEQCGGRPCIRGMRIRVTDVLDLLSNGLTSQQVLEELPDLEPEDIREALVYALGLMHGRLWSAPPEARTLEQVWRRLEGRRRSGRGSRRIEDASRANPGWLPRWSADRRRRLTDREAPR